MLLVTLAWKSSKLTAGKKLAFVSGERSPQLKYDASPTLFPPKLDSLGEVSRNVRLEPPDRCAASLGILIKYQSSGFHSYWTGRAYRFDGE